MNRKTTGTRSIVRPIAPTASIQTRPIALGIFTYLNIQPVYYGLLREQREYGSPSFVGAMACPRPPAFPPLASNTREDKPSPLRNSPAKTDIREHTMLDNIELVTGIPTRLNAALLSGEVDLSSVSGFAYAEHRDQFCLIPHLSISAPGAVESVLLFNRYDNWQALDGKKIAVTNHSASAVNLLRVLCKHRHSIEPRFVTMPSDLDAMFTTCDAALVIGDTALIEGTTPRNIAGLGTPTIFDLGQEWAEWTDLPFVFGVWAARADRAEAIRASGVLEQLYRSKTEGLASIDQIGQEQAPRLGLSPERCAHYLRQMTYDLSEADLQGWRLFLELSLPGFRWDEIRWL